MNVGHELTGHINVDNLYRKIRIKMNHTFADFCKPSVYKEIVGRGCKYEFVENMRHGHERAYQADCKTACNPK